MAKEVELRIVIDNSSQFEKWLNDNATHKARNNQKDYYLEPKDSPFLYKDAQGKLQGDKWLRIRSNGDGSSILCLKDVFRDDKGEYLYSDEHESDISNAESTLTLFKSLGYVDVITVIKDREEWAYDNLTIAKDVIDGLGTFFEVEFCDNERSYEECLDIVLNFIKNKIGNNYKKVKGGYPQLIWDKKEEVSL